MSGTLNLFDRKAPPPTCFECDHVAEHRHHVVPRSMGGTRTVWLCTKCHAAAHHFEKDPWMRHGNLIKAGLRRAKASGKELGVSGRITCRKLADKNKAESDSRALKMAPILDQMEHKMGIKTLEGKTQYLNHIGYPTPRGKTWHMATVRAVIKRLERMEQELAQKRAA